MSHGWYGILLAAVFLTASGGSATAGDGVYGGYVGSAASMNTDIENMGRRALSNDALHRHAAFGAPGRNGPDVTLHIMFPSQQTGLSNITMVMLVPEQPGAHGCQALAQEKSRTELYSLFIPKKDVRAGRLYDVVLSDAMGDQFIVGRISVASAPAQDFTLNAPQLTPGSPHYQGPLSAQGFAIAYPGGTPGAATWRPGGTEGPGPAHGQAWLRAKEEFRREAALQPWVLGMKVLSITPYMLAAIGHPDVHVQGVVVYAVNPGGPAQLAGVRKGDLIVEAGGQRCVTAAEFVQSARAAHGQLDLVMYSQLHHAVVHLRVVANGVSRPLAGSGAGARWQAPGTQQGAAQQLGSAAPPQAGNNPLPPSSTAYTPPQVGPGFVPPGQAAAGQGAGPWQQPQGPANPVLPGSSNFQPPRTGPGYQPAGH
jgi:hypothetical protein